MGHERDTGWREGNNDRDDRNRQRREADGADIMDQSAAQGQEPIPTRKPSQAEGDRATVDADIREKEREG